MKQIYDKQSLWSKVLNYSFAFTPSKKISSDILLTKKFIAHKEKIKKKFTYLDKHFFKETYDEKVVYYFNGRPNEMKKKVLIYIHGGNFVEQANKFQINFAKKIAKMTDSTLVLPIYDLLPIGNALKLQNFLIDLYIKILSESPESIYLLGDSAGGGASLSLGMLLRDKSLKVPDHIIMLSPWLDLSMSNEKILDDEKKDYMNGLEGTRYEGMLWAGDLDIKDFRVSPMYGEFHDIGYLTIIFGGCEILTSECQRFIDILEKQNVEYNSLFYPHEGHDFAVFPTKEGKQVIRNIAEILGGCGNGGHTRGDN